MKLKLVHFYILTFFLFSDFVIFAQGGPGDDTEGGDLEGDDLPPAGISSKLIYLALVGILFAVYTYRKNRKLA